MWSTISPDFNKKLKIKLDVVVYLYDVPTSKTVFINMSVAVDFVICRVRECDGPAFI